MYIYFKYIFTCIHAHMCAVLKGYSYVLKLERIGK